MQQNRTDFDATFCGKLPLNQTNLIQPHGVLLIVSGNDFIITQASENISDLVPFRAEEIVGNTIEQFISADSFSQLRSKTKTSFDNKVSIPLTFINGGLQQDYLSILHKQDDRYIIEIGLPQFFDEKETSFFSVFQDVKSVMSALNAASTIEEVCRIAAREIKKFSGFDKVMIYSFDEGWNGDVIAEAKEPGMDSYLGLKFPASDIPKPARDMYFKNPYRIIPNRDYQPVRLYPVLNPATNTFTDLSQTDLRSVAAVHLEYLKNMNVSASMSTRIIHEGKLWGLIACHHRQAKYLSFEQCAVFELLSTILSTKITELYHLQIVSIKKSFQDLYTELVEDIYKQRDMAGVWNNNKEDMLQYLKADGLVYCWKNRIESIGSTPNQFELETLRYWLQGKANSKIVHLPSLSSVFDEASQYTEVGSGLLVLPIQTEKGNFLLAFRTEAVTKVDWGGNPNEAVQFEPNTSAYHPRNSFNQWQEIVRNTATPWMPEEVEAAENLRNVLIDFTLNHEYQ